MQSKFSGTFTGWQGTPSGGALPTNYTQPWGHSLSTTLPSDVRNVSQWTWAGTSPDGQVAYDVTVDITNPVVFSSYNPDACRVLCLYLVSRLNDVGVVEACEALTDI